MKSRIPEQKFVSVPMTLAALPLIFAASCYSQDDFNTYQLDITTEILTEGGVAAEDELLIGGEFRYFFLRQSPFHLYLSSGYRTDSDDEGSTFDIYNADFGSQWDFGYFWGNRAFLEAAVGAAYIQESYAISLIDRNASSDFDEFTYKAAFGLGVEWQNTVGTKLFINQYGSDYRTLGISLSYSF
ncbi:hypothetical protein G5S52_04505 [Grimontia sp. S25]|uniref:Outer membrane protein beta-barrel domain-containing protein n=1 Tax=Grimontia sedimenti TaxID=2711294 RepID=A0A6M1RH59_9GAMM|nr:hypothetical protein [Grimontia sedimenti]NGN96938.1 hypothetical protein [Grimontia sedimenti]